MKRKSIISLLLLCMTVGMFTTSCQDMLTPNSERHAYEVAEDSLYSYWGILKSLQNVAERYVILNECRADLVDGSGYVSDTIAALMNFGQKGYAEKYKDGASAYMRVTDYYHIINSCNAYLAMCDTTTTTGTNRKYMIKEYAQVKSIRAWVYLQLVYAYGEVPFYTKPMLTTDEINNFINDPNHATVKAADIADKLAVDLEPMANVEEMYGYPEYNNYGDVSIGNSHYVCHSSKCMFPVNVVMGDLYLLQGQATQSEATCAKAAQHYYDFINTKYCGPISTSEYYFTGDLDATKDYPLYDWAVGNPYNEPFAMSREYETITVIPSNSGKLEGKVNTDINRLFGFEAEMFTSGGESAEAGIALNPQYERQLLPSKGYELIAGAQNYEIYEATRENGTLKISGMNILPGVGDARQAWIYSTGGRQWNFRVGDDNLYGKMVSKQNPNGIYSNAYPVIYRKSTIWLRFAEALNRAGFPSYAFAILKTGLCSNTNWFPRVPSSLTLQNMKYYNTSSSLYDYKVKDAVYTYYIPGAGLYPSGNVDELQEMTSIEALQALVEEFFEQQYEDSKDEDGNPTIEKQEFDMENVLYAPKNENAFANEPILDPEADAPYACHYLDLRELKRTQKDAAGYVRFLDFNQPYLRGVNSSYYIYYKQPGKLLNQTPILTSYRGTDDDTYTIGIHQRGCGFVRGQDPANARSSYQYVDMVAKKIKENTGAEVTASDIYGGAIDGDVRDAVEDLIIDEMALELAFEGTRFSDLCRVAQRRGTDYLAKRVSMRSGVEDGTLRSVLQNEKNWYLPFPQK